MAPKGMGQEKQPGAGAGSRLERLLALLDTGRTAHARRQAAAHLGELAHDGAAARALAERLLPYLAAQSYETRAAAAAAAGHAGRTAAPAFGSAAALCAAAGETSALAASQAAQGDASAETEGYLTLRSLDLTTVLAKGQVLLASTGIEFEVADDLSKSKGERLKEARKELRRQLGLSGEQGGTSVDRERMEKHTVRDDIVGDEDLAAAPTAQGKQDDDRVAAGSILSSLAAKNKGKAKEAATAAAAAKAAKRKEQEQEYQRPPEPEMFGPGGKKLSARERLMAKRKAKLNKGRVGGGATAAAAKPAKAAPAPTPAAPAPASEDPAEERPAKRARVEATAPAAPSGGAGPTPAAQSADAAGGQDPAPADGEWPFTAFAEQLVNNLFQARWEERHGAASALRELLSVQAGAAHVTAPLPGIAPTREEVAAARSSNRAWLQDTACRLLCVLALDRFVDMAGERLMAPVREAAAQALGVAAHGLRAVAPNDVLEATRRLAVLHAAEQWEVRHAAMLGLKYLIAAASADDGGEGGIAWRDAVYSAVVPSAAAALGDSHDDVQAAAAEALLAIASTGSPALAGEARASLAAKLWELLADIDELAASALPVLKLISVLYSRAGALRDLGGGEEGLEASMTSLRPFLHHISPNVREEAAKALEAVVAASEAEGVAAWLGAEDGSALPDALQAVLQAVLCECCRTKASARVLAALRAAWAHISAIGARAGGLAGAMGARADELLEIASTPPGAPLPLDVRLGGHEGTIVPLGDEGMHASVSMMMEASRLVGKTLAQGGASEGAIGALAEALDSRSASARQVVALTLEAAAWAGMCLPQPLAARLHAIAAVPLATAAGAGVAAYTELEAPVARFRGTVRALLTAGPQAGLAFSTAIDAETLDLPTAKMLADGALQALGGITKTPTMTLGQERALDSAMAVATKLNASVDELQMHHAATHTGVLAASAAALLAATVAKPAAAGDVAALALNGEALQEPLLAWLRGAVEPQQREVAGSALSALVVCGARQLAGVPKPVGMKLMMKLKEEACADVAGAPDRTATASDPDAAPSATRLGGEAALRALVRLLGERLFEDLPLLWKTMHMPVANPPGASLPAAAGLSYGKAFHTASVIAPTLPDVLRASHALPLSGAALDCLGHPLVAIRNEAIGHLAAAAASGSLRDATMAELHTRLGAMLGDAGDALLRRGAAATVVAAVRALREGAVPHVPLLLVPVLRRMSDPDEGVRDLAGEAFSELAPLLAIARGAPPPPGVPQDVVSRAHEESRVLEQLLDNSTIEDATLPFQLNGFTLRSYQQDGVNWLSFLARFGLHGVLADDMGLGKTIQTICALASSAAAARDGQRAGEPAALGPRPSLVVCPTTLVGHWANELRSALGGGEGGKAPLLVPLELAGAVGERAHRLQGLHTSSVAVTSYEAMRADAAALSAIEWDYVVLDEGHAIRNHKSKMAAAAKAVGSKARHRLLLSGTPIQNRAHEMWSLFDFLMPGFLGTQRQFHARFGKPIMAAREPKSARDAEAGERALQRLHRQVMPFVLRRTKDKVLKELPPKIIQDVYVDASPLQVAMYDAVGRDSKLGAAVEGEGGEQASAHVFQAIQYVRKLCTHPALVYDPKVGAHAAALAASGAPLRGGEGLCHAPKLQALADILRQCGIGEDKEANDGESGEGEGGAGRHRVLVFAQLKATLDLVEKDLFQSGAVSGVQWLRLDGTVAAKARFGVAQRFNADPTIDVLLLSTSVGGHGLNLTTADTVVFLEHDWNPMNDLQAMDRAHRLGQRRSVSVYRLVTRRTLEERIMGIQRFKKHVADAVVNADNASMRSMDTGQLLELFKVEEGEGKRAGGAPGSDAALAEQATAGKGKKGGLQKMLGELESMWAENQYDEEIDTDQFVKKLR